MRSLRALLLMSVLIPHLATASTGQVWNFRVFLDDSEVGTHTFRVVDANGERRVESDARFTVKFLFIDAYTYDHRARERWTGNCLKTIEARTDDNGDHYTVRGLRRDDGFELATAQGRVAVPGCVMSFAYWNPDMLRQPQLLNAQTGELIEVRTETLGEESITVRGQPVLAQHYVLHAPKFRIDLWYAADRRWVQLESRTDSGRLLRYRMQ